jgi:uncharacterized surface protein with fasciclin (FAS1) repeats
MTGELIMNPIKLLATGIVVVCLTAPVKAADLVDTAAKTGTLNTLLTAVDAAGLSETLKGKGPFTFFAPTDEAFASLPEGSVEALLQPENKDKLIALLTYHLVPGALPSSYLANKMKAQTIQGGEVKIDLNRGVMINHALVIKPDIAAENGIIHVIDEVIIPYL